MNIDPERTMMNPQYIFLQSVYQTYQTYHICISDNLEIILNSVYFQDFC